MENNKAFFATVKNVKRIEGADKIVLVDITVQDIAVASVVMGVEITEGQQVVYFDSNMCVGEKVTEAYEVLKTYLAKNNRVKAVRFNKFGVVSNGLAVEFDKFLIFDKNLKFNEGEAFLTIGNTEIAKKYLPKPIHIPTVGKKKKVKSGIEIVAGQFNFHIDTKQLLRNITELSPSDVVSITEKLHGTSAIYSKVLVKRKNLFIKLLSLIKIPVQDTYYKFICASRTVIKTENDKQGFYDTDIWTHSGEYFKDKIRKGETIYAEVVGYLPNGSWIQKGYRYGLLPNNYSLKPM